MKEENKLLVFDKKEVLLVLLLTLCLFLGSFIFGVKVGKEYSFSKWALRKKKLKHLKYLREKKKKQGPSPKKNIKPVSKQQSYDLLKRKIEEELNKTKSATDDPLGKVKPESEQVQDEQKVGEKRSF